MLSIVLGPVSSLVRLRDLSRLVSSVLDSSVDSVLEAIPCPLNVRIIRLRILTREAPSVLALFSLAMGSSSLTLSRSSMVPTG